MKRSFSTTEALAMVIDSDEMESDPPQDPSSSDSEKSTTTASESDLDFFPQPSSSPSSSSETEEETEATPVSSTWTGRNGVVWSSTNQETLFHPPAMGRKKGGPTHYATVRVHNIESAFGLFFTPEVIDLVVENTNLYGHLSQQKSHPPALKGSAKRELTKPVCSVGNTSAMNTE
ncbi:piggyBac transposable element-derived protein 4-like [Xyrichtys novacula]|uniref:PiggyBac transposable element-derived protein 4-like n=1 Tax=Xyrichtys novacula TaxID=13765 RepID=A0AAV1FW14_XYRNO|nr:piggyBac transposable element-derived protein 4-like [Xyrichtys novacula]